ncbi:MAG: hypothetical protein HZA78_03090 [Candidatus Schekmanbacteria bacterium]|nr:hypothetical protein [Candidatus Schekmanbacteria bacterium]
MEGAIREYVLCANTQDRDFPPRNRYCRGRIYVEDEFDEAGYEYRCPECERPVFPSRHQKKRFKELHIKVSREGVKSYIFNQLGKLKVNVKDIAEGVYKVDLGNLGVVVCIVDYCCDSKYLAHDWASNNSACYIAVNPKDFEERFLDEEWLARVSLADLVSGQVDLEAILQKIPDFPPRTVLKASIPVYTKGHLPIVPESITPPQKGRRFVVEVGVEVVLVEGETVIFPQARMRFHVFQILYEQFLDDLKNNVLPGDFRTLNVDNLSNAVEERTGKEVEDVTSIRRTVNRIQTDIETTLKKKLGLPIDREDIIQTCRWQGGGKDDEFGYRLNPSTVAIRPFQS